MKYRITDEWLIKFKTKNGGYTRDQLSIVGVKWQPVKGWKHLVINSYISLSDKLRFERLSRESY